MALNIPSLPTPGTIATVSNWATKVIDSLNYFAGNAGTITLNAGLIVTGQILGSDAAGPAVVGDEAATTTNPTLCPNQAELDTGIGWASDTLHFILGGASYGNLSTTAFTISASVLLDGANGIDINPGSDIDADLITVGVTGAPKIYWDESQDTFNFNKGLWLNGDVTTGGVAPDGLSGVYANKSETDPSGLTIGVRSSLSHTAVGGDNNQEVRGFYTEIGTSSSNTDNWTNGSAFTGFYSTLSFEGTTTTIAGGYNFVATSAIYSSATLTNRYGLYISESIGTGAVTNQYGIYIENMTKGGTLDYGVYIAGADTAAIYVASGNIISGGNVYGLNAAGPAFVNEAATTTNPTICPNKAEEDTGIGWASDTLHFVLGGASYANLSTTNLSLSGGIAGGGVSPLDYAHNYLGGNFTSQGASTLAAKQIYGGVLTGHSGDTAVVAGSYYANSIALGVANTHTAQLICYEPDISGGFTPTVAATVLIVDAPTEGTTNAALYVAAGDTNIDTLTTRGNVGVTGNITVTGTVDGVDVATLSSNFTTHDGQDANDAHPSLGLTGAKVYEDSDITYSDDLNTQITFDSEYYDDADYHSTSTNTGRLTVPENGRYLVWARVVWAANGTGYRKITLIGNISSTDYDLDEDYDHNPSATYECTLNVQAIIEASTGDYFYCTVRQTSGGGLDIDYDLHNSPIFGIQKLS